jgi:prepilin peptidase CpaA
MAQHLSYFGILLCLVAVAWIDFRTQKISNRWTLLNLIAFVGLLLFSPLHPLSFSVLIYPVLMLMVGFVLFVLNVMGAGDAKYLASLFLIIPLTWQAPFFELLALSTCLVASVLIIVNILRNYSKVIKEIRNRNLKGLSLCFGTRFSYAPVILFAWLWFALQLRIVS